MEKKIAWFCAIGIFLLGGRLLLFSLFAPQLFDGQKLSFQTTLLDEPQEKGFSHAFTTVYGNFFGAERVYVTFSSLEMFHYGDNVQISGRITKKVLGGNNVFLSLYNAHVEILQNHQNPLLQYLSKLRQSIQSIYYDAFDRTDAALLLGIVFGTKEAFPKAFLQDFQAVGVVHVIAASGMNVTMVAGFLFPLALIFAKRQFAAVIAVGGVIFYAFFSGLAPSIVRATIMALFVFGGQLFGRQYNGFYGLFLAGLGMLLYRPELVFDVGFQLSIMSTLGILVLKPLMPKVQALDDVTTTISAQLMTVPILIGSFGQYGILSVFVNALVLWTIPPLMIIGGAGTVVALIFAPLGNYLLWIAIPILHYFEYIVVFFGEMKWNLQIDNLPLSLIIGYYLLLGSIILFLLQKRREANLITESQQQEETKR